MPKLKNVEKYIYEIEDFIVTIKQNGQNKRDDLVLPKQYRATRMMRNSCSVNDFKMKFKIQFPGFDIDVINYDGSIARGQTKLSTVRDTYLLSDDDEIV